MLGVFVSHLEFKNELFGFEEGFLTSGSGARGDGEAVLELGMVIAV